MRGRPPKALEPTGGLFRARCWQGRIGQMPSSMTPEKTIRPTAVPTTCRKANTQNSALACLAILPTQDILSLGLRARVAVSDLNKAGT